METVEIRNYNKYLDRARKVGNKTNLTMALGISSMFGFIFIFYAYSFWVGGLLVVDPEILNKGRRYTGGDVLACLFAVIMGGFSLGGAAPNFKTVAEGRVAGKMAYDIIERKPRILLDDKSKKIVNPEKVEGSIEFENVTFMYPSKSDQKILKDFSFKFEKGKTTAIVGPSGSGKSTIVQLIERFYDP